METKRSCTTALSNPFWWGSWKAGCRNLNLCAECRMKQQSLLLCRNVSGKKQDVKHVIPQKEADVSALFSNMINPGREGYDAFREVKSGAFQHLRREK